MADRFLALLPSDETGRALSAAIADRALRTQGLHEVIARPDLRVLADPGMEARPIGSGEGVLLGRLFEAEANCRRAPQRLESSWVRNPAEGLFRHGWGAYVAFSTEAQTGGVAVLRDPSGAMPAYFVDWEGVPVVFSDADLAMAMGVLPSRLSWAFVAHYLAFPELRLPITGVIGVTELLAGQVARFSERRTQVETVWRPSTFGGRGSDGSLSEAAQRVGSTTRACVQALAREHPAIAVRLSGGLDSSIVTRCLDDAPAAVTCINMLTPGPDGDERRYAQAVADASGRSLQVLTPTPDAISTVNRARQLRPGPPALLEGIDRILAQAAIELGATAVFTGGGGDNVFAHLSSVTPASDRLLATGPGLGFWRTAAEVAEINQVTTWRVAWGSLRRSLTPRMSWRPDLRFLRPGATPERPISHPWLEAAKAVSPGQIAHIAALLRVQNHVDPALRLGSVAMVHPLLAQPVVEACLGVPSWLWVAGGVDRAVARAAFRGDVPELVLKRRGKGRLDSYCGRVYAHSRATLRDLLLEGRLASQGLLDVAGIGAYLDKPGIPRDADFYRLFGIADVELWARAWSEA